MIDQTLSQALQKEIPILTAQIRSLYAEFDKKFHLNGAKIPITFGMEPDLLGSYTRGSCHEKEHFHFSLLFIGYAVKNPLKKKTDWIFTNMNMLTICSIIFTFPQSISGSTEPTEAPGNTAVP